jgi:hypothetical protein
VAVEQAIPLEDNTVIRRVYPGEGEAPIETLFATDDELERVRAQEHRAELWDRVKHPIRTISHRFMELMEGESHAA